MPNPLPGLEDCLAFAAAAWAAWACADLDDEPDEPDEPDDHDAPCSICGGSGWALHEPAEPWRRSYYVDCECQ